MKKMTQVSLTIWLKQKRMWTLQLLHTHVETKTETQMLTNVTYIVNKHWHCAYVIEQSVKKHNYETLAPFA